MVIKDIIIVWQKGRYRALWNSEKIQIELKPKSRSQILQTTERNKKGVVKLSSGAFIGHVLIAERKTSVRHQG